jgi:hypothetical protein
MLLLSWLGGVLFLGGCTGGTQPAENDKPQLPIYNGASDIRAQVIPKSRINDFPTEITTFQTPDRPDLVFAFYARVLLNDGWSSNSPVPPVPDKRYYSKGPRYGERASSYGLVITITQQANHIYLVELNMAEYLPY